MGGLKCGKSVEEIYPRESTWQKFTIFQAVGLSLPIFFENVDFLLHAINVRILNTFLQNGVCMGEMKCMAECFD